MPPEVKGEWMHKTYIDKAPIWCSVDLRDGNQALIDPMNLQEKIEYFKTLIASKTKKLASGVFGADMKVSLLNDGPVTIIVDSKLKF